MNVLVIGGSAAGLKAACRVARLNPDADVKVIERGEFAAWSLCGLPYFLSGEVQDISTLARAPNGTLKDAAYFRDIKRVEIVSGLEATAIDRAARTVHCRDAEGELRRFPYDKLVIATGSHPKKPSFPGIDLPGVSSFTRPADAIKLRQDLERGLVSRVAVVGAGFIGIELCEAFRALWGAEVVLLERERSVLAGMLDAEVARLVEAELTTQGVDLRLNCPVEGIATEGEKLVLRDSSGEMQQVDRVVLALGVKPDTDLAASAGSKLGKSGGIAVDRKLTTSDPNIYAAGDCVETTGAVDGRGKCWSLASLATRMGRIAADNICGGKEEFAPVAGTTILKAFDLSVGSTGLTERSCRQAGLSVQCVWGTFHDRLHYYPDAAPAHYKLVIDGGDGRLLGAQMLSRGQIQPALDVISGMIANQKHIADLDSLEVSYAPPYAQPLSPLHALSFTHANGKAEGVKLVPPNGASNLPSDTLILDLRTPTEREAHPRGFGDLEVLAIPVEELRDRLSEVPPNRPVVTLCQMGSRSWDAVMIMKQNGWRDLGIFGGGALFMVAQDSAPAK